MENIRTVQTAFRLTPDLLLKLKNKARIEKRSLNSLVESILESSIQESCDRETILYKQLSEINNLNDQLPDYIAQLKGCVSITEEQKAQDDRLSYILRGDEDIF